MSVLIIIMVIQKFLVEVVNRVIVVIKLIYYDLVIAIHILEDAYNVFTILQAIIVKFVVLDSTDMMIMMFVSVSSIFCSYLLDKKGRLSYFKHCVQQQQQKNH